MTTSIEADLRIVHVVRGRVDDSADVAHRSATGQTFLAPALDLDGLAPSRGELPPASHLSVSAIIDFLVETGRALDLDTNRHLAAALEAAAVASALSRRLVELSYRGLADLFDRDALEYQVERELGSAILDGWIPAEQPGSPPVWVHAVPPRLVHVLAGNAPVVAGMSIVRGALTKGLHVLKLPANDLLTATAILRTMRDIDPDHPTVRSFSAAYWRGGDVAVEDRLYRPQYFDKIVVWGGEAAVRNAVQYAGPGLEIVTYDPKTSISLVGREAFDAGADLRAVAAAAADDSALLNQDACAASRFHFVEGSLEEVDRYCELLAAELATERAMGDAVGPPAPAAVRESVEILRMLEPDFRVWGRTDGSGLVIRSSHPVDFHPTAKTVNVLPIGDLDSAISHVNAATQTVGVYPAVRKAHLRDRLAAQGAQRIVTLGSAMRVPVGTPHDGSLPLQRLIRLASDED